MDGLLAMKTSLPSEEVDSIYDDLLEDKYGFEVDDDLANLCKLDDIKTEMISYVTKLLKAEFNINEDIDAMLKWYEYKSLHNITLEE